MENNKSHKILPLVENNDINSNCWIHSMLAIIALSPNYEEWLSTHLEMNANEDFYTYYGHGPWLYLPSYFSDILDINEVNIFSISHKCIVDYIIDRINNDKYVVIDCDYNIMYCENARSDMPHIHDTFIYGYDNEKKSFLVRRLKGLPIDDEIFYEIIEAAFLSAQKYYKENRQQKVYKRFYSLGITEMSLKPYKNVNAAFEGLCRIRNDKMASRSVRETLDENGNVIDSMTYYSGSAVLLSAENKLTEISNNLSFYNRQEIKEFYTGLIMFTKMFCETRYIILKSMKWIGKQLEVQDSRYFDVVSEFEKSCSEFKNLYMTVFKKYKSGDLSIFEKLNTKLKSMYAEQIKILTKYDEVSMDCFRNYECRLADNLDINI